MAPPLKRMCGGPVQFSPGPLKGPLSHPSPPRPGFGFSEPPPMRQPGTRTKTVQKPLRPVDLGSKPTIGGFRARPDTRKIFFTAEPAR